MELTYDFIRESIIERFDQNLYDYCDEYGEPGYSHDHGATTPMVVLGDFWCRCGKVLREDGTTELHDLAFHHPLVWAKMEEQGVQFEWSDEWTTDHENGNKCYRTQGDSYSWQSSIMWTDGGDFLTPDDELDDWIEEVVNRSTKCLPSRVWSSGDLEAAGWATFNGTYESGWHPGQTDDPATITAQIRDEMGDEDELDIVFLLDESSQFYVGFSAWTRKVNDDD